MSRIPITDDTEKEILTKSARRCCICFGLKGTFDETSGQIAHLDQNNSNNKFENLAYLCLPCHDKYDSKTSQSKGYTIKEAKHYRDSLYSYVEKWRNKDETRTITNFTQMAQAIWRPLSDNGRARTSFGPNSGVNSAAPVKWNLEIWETAKREIILPNNKIIGNLIQDHFDLIPKEYTPIFKEMLSHIYAFEKHCEQSNMDYTDHQFPLEFNKIIDETCLQGEEHKEELIEIEIWLLESIASHKFQVIDAYIFGSVLRAFYKNADVDLCLLLADDNVEEIKESAKKSKDIQESFYAKFGRKLHAIIFSSIEREGFYDFLGRLSQKRVLACQ
jgi:predicted nucleotidyltransferase